MRHHSTDIHYFLPLSSSQIHCVVYMAWVLVLMLFSFATNAQDLPATVAPGEKSNALITNIYTDTDLRQALSDVATQAGVIIVADNTVQGTVSAELKDVPLSKTLDILLQGGGYCFAKVDDYYLVGAPDPNNPNYYLLCATEEINLKYSSPQTIMALLGTVYGRYMRFDDSALPNRNRTGGANATTTTPALTHRLVVTAPRRMLERIKQDIVLLDRAPKQVMLEAAVIEVSNEALKDIGINWASRSLQLNLNNNGPNLIYSELANTEFVALTALLNNGEARLRANPRVATIEDQTAELEVGKESYFAIVSGPVNYPYTSLQQIKSGISLNITPHIIEDTSEIAVQVEPEVRDVTGKGPNGLPEITLRRASTNVRIRNGQSIIIGGLINEFTQKTVNRIPLLGDLPLFGPLFRSTSTRQNRSEVVIIITPHLLEDGAPAGGVVDPGLLKDLQLKYPGLK